MLNSGKTSEIALLVFQYTLPAEIDFLRRQTDAIDLLLLVPAQIVWRLRFESICAKRKSECVRILHAIASAIDSKEMLKEKTNKRKLRNVNLFVCQRDSKYILN
jgi:hypothetical protein